MVSLRRTTYWILLGIAWMFCSPTLAQTWPVDSIYPQLKRLRISFHIFEDAGGGNNFQADSTQDVRFLHELESWVNYRLGHLVPLDPVQSSPFVSDTRVRIRLDSIYYHSDQYAWDCSDEIDGYYMRSVYVDSDSLLTFKEKYQTLPIFFGSNYSIAGGFSSNLGSKTFIAIRGYYAVYQSKTWNDALRECGRNLLHEICHAMGLSHNFQGGEHGDQCDHCDDDGCPPEGSSNNIMDYWPNYGYALSVCQLEFLHDHLSGLRGNISDVLINDSCYSIPGRVTIVEAGKTIKIIDTLYMHGDLTLQAASQLVVEGYLSMPLHGKILLEPGSSIRINGGTIGNLCGELWDGIVLLGDGLNGNENPATLDLQNATLENAIKALDLNAPFVLTGDENRFVNNVYGLVIHGVLQNRISIGGFSFETNKRLNMYDLGITPASFIDIDGVTEVQLVDCSFENQTGSLTFSRDYLGIGVLVRGMALRMQHCRMENLTRGIVFYPNDQGSLLSVENSQFVKNQIAVLSGYEGFQSIKNNRFELQKLDRRVTTGIYLIEPKRYDISENEFFSEFGSGDQIGILLKNPGSETSLIEENSVFNLPVGFMVADSFDRDSLLLSYFNTYTRGASLPFGPIFYNNEFFETQSWLSWKTRSGYGISIGNHSGSEIKTMENGSWPLGGFTWYNQLARQGGFNDSIPAEIHPRDGIWYYSNTLSLQQILPPMSEDEVDRTELQLSEYFRQYQIHLEDQKNVGIEDPFQWLQVVSDYPALARSSRMASYFNDDSLAQQSWIVEQLARISNKYSSQDSLMIRLALHTGRQNQDVWNTLYPQAIHPSDMSLWDTLEVARPTPQFTGYYTFYLPKGSSSEPPEFRLYPVPATDWIHIVPKTGIILGEGWEYRLFSMSGTILRAGSILDWSNLTLSLKDLPDGIYMVELWQNERYLGSCRFIKLNEIK